MPLLPARPFAISRSFTIKSLLGTALLPICGIAVLVGGLYWQSLEIKNMTQDLALKKTGVKAVDCSVEGRETSHHFLVNSYDLKVEYLDQKGEIHSGRSEFTFLFRSVDQDVDAEVYYDANHPDKFVLSWALYSPGARWGAIAGFIAITLLLGLGLCALTGRVLRNYRAAVAAAERSDEITVPLVLIVPFKQYGRVTNVEYQYEVQTHDQKRVTRKVAYGVKHLPCYANGDENQLLALRSDLFFDHPVVLRKDFYPFVLTDLQESHVRQELAKLKKTAPASKAPPSQTSEPPVT